MTLPVNVFALARFGFLGGRTGVVVGVRLVAATTADVPGGGISIVGDGEVDAAVRVEKSTDFTKRCVFASVSGCNDDNV